MNTFSDILTRMPFLSIRLKISSPPHKAIEKLKNAIAAQEPVNSETQDYFFTADFEEHTFLIQCAYIKRFKGKVLIPDRNISYWRAYNPVDMDQTPIFHGMIVRHGYGDESIIKGNFGIGTPFYLALIAVVPLLVFLLMQVYIQCLFPLAALFLFLAILSIFRFIYERKRIYEFLLTVFKNETCNEGM
jgi:hypothetical protein